MNKYHIELSHTLHILKAMNRTSEMGTWYTGCPATLWKYFKLLFLRSFPVRNVVWTWVRFSAVTKLRIEIKDDSCTSSVTGYPTFQSTRDGVPEWAVPWPMDWSWWSAELAPAVTGPHFPCYVKNIAYGCKENRREELHHRIFNAARRMNDPDVLRKIQIIFNLKYP
jgi:hypothetical protein